MATLFNADEVYQIAIDVEQNGEAFYQAAARRATNVEVREMFTELAAWENGHASLLTGLRDKLDQPARLHTPSDPNGEIAAYLKALSEGTIFRKDKGLEALLDRCSGPVEVLRLAIRFEEESVKLFQTMKQLVPQQFGGGSIDRLVAEEQQHAAMLRGKVFALTGEQVQ
jgi:rubrerythrin